MILACPGVGHVARGFETFASECFDALSGREDVRMVLAKGAGERSDGERPVRTLRRDTAPARILGRLARRDGYFAEQAVFALALVPLIRKERPDVVFTSDWTVVATLGRLRPVLGGQFALVLSNGAPGPPPYNPAVDHVQQLSPPMMEWALEAGEPPERHTLLPYGVEVGPRFEPVTPERRRALREHLGLPADRMIVLSVAALNRWLKRLDYVIEEVAALEEPRPYLVLLGQQEEETSGVLELARRRLGEHGFVARTVAPQAVADYYDAADVFTLASLGEGLGRVLLEALAHGLPVLAHYHPIPEFALGGHGYLADLGARGELAALIRRIGPEDRTDERQRERQRFVVDNFGWQALAPRYVEMFRRAALATQSTGAR